MPLEGPRPGGGGGGGGGCGGPQTDSASPPLKPAPLADRCALPGAFFKRPRVIYEQLSKDPNSLANLDQDLPNYAQHQIPIHSLPQEWLWCESWCGNATKEKVGAVGLGAWGRRGCFLSGGLLP